MPLISVNIKDSGGLASHSNNVTASIERHLNNKSYADLVFVARNGSVHCHQAVLESLSPTLQGMFQAHNCCTCSGSSCGRREVIQVHLPDVSRETLRCVLAIIYSGKCHVSSTAQGKEIRQIMSLLDLKLPGDLKQETGGLESSVLHTPSSSQSSRLETGAKRKRSEETASRHSPAKVARTEGPRGSPETLLIEMAKRLMPFSENKSLPCNFPACGVMLTHLDMTEHFKLHFREREEQRVSVQAHARPGAITFRCEHCDKEFKFRRALDVHLKKCSFVRASKEISPRNRLDSFSSSSSDGRISDNDVRNKTSGNIAKDRILANKSLFSDESDSSTGERDISPKKRIPTISTSSGENTATVDDVDDPVTISETGDDEKQPEPAVSKKNVSPPKRDHLVCKHCNEEVKSEWYLHPSRHDCKKNENIEEDGYYCQHCKNPYSNKSNLRKHEASCPIIKAEGNIDTSMSLNQSESNPYPTANSKFECPKCGKIFSRRGNLKTHIGIKHYQEKLTSIYHGTKCKECNKEFDSNEELLKHVSFGHEKILRYLLGREGLLLPAKREKLKEESKQDQLVNDGEKMVTPAKKSSSPMNSAPTDHENSYKCPKCEQRFSNRYKLKAHVGITHYSEKLRAAYPGTHCTICDKECRQPSWLQRHISIKHEKVLVYLVGKEGLQLPPKNPKGGKGEGEVKEPKEEMTEKPLTETDDQEEEAEQLYFGEHCVICEKNVSSVPAFAMRHYFGKHLQEKLVKEDPQAYEEFRCFLCGFFVQESKKPRLSYLSHFSQHSELVKNYLSQDGYKLPEKSLSYSEGEHGFRVKKVRIDVKLTEEIRVKVQQLNAEEDEVPSEERSEEAEEEEVSSEERSDEPHHAIEAHEESEPEEPQLSMEELLKCFLCHKDFNTSGGQTALLSHYSRDHYRLELEHNYITKQGNTWSEDRRCGDCSAVISTREEYVHHLGVRHRHVLQFLPAKFRPSALAPTEMEKSPEKEVFRCPVLDCDSEKETRKALLIHLLMIHFNKDMELEYRETFRAMKVKKCPDCGMALLDNYLYFIKHLAVDHEKVLNYVTDEEKESKESEKKCDEKEPVNESRQSDDEDEGSRRSGGINNRKGFKSAEFVDSSDSDAEGKRVESQTGVIMNGSSSLNKQSHDCDEAKLDQSFDLRAILDSDSDSE